MDIIIDGVKYAGIASSDNQINGLQKSQIVSSLGDSVTVTGNKLDVNSGTVAISSLPSSDSQLGAVMVNGGDGAKNDAVLTLTDQSTVYSNTAPVTPHVLIAYNESDTDVRVRLTTGTTAGWGLGTGQVMSMDMGASEVLYFYCPTDAGKIISYSTRANY